jgi:hypothetical protein
LKTFIKSPVKICALVYYVDMRNAWQTTKDHKKSSIRIYAFNLKLELAIVLVRPYLSWSQQRGMAIIGFVNSFPREGILS